MQPQSGGFNDSGNKDAEDEARSARPTVENVDKIMEFARDWKEIISYELLPSKETLNSDLHCQELSGLKQAINQKWPELLHRKLAGFHQDNAGP
ncbi:hypothetical protein RB195_009349 [Necator americanus]|uniref:Uncharacterized protein n=1 Tax=Necator americanus TaxID=51031 RepID=A0ABR1CSX2_NECAM